MPSAASYTNKIRFAASVKDTKAQLVGGVGNLTQGSIAGCGLDIQYTPIEYVENCGCNTNPATVDPLPEFYITTIAGDGVSGYGSGGGIAINARLFEPLGVALDSSRNVYIADTNNHLIRKVTAGGVISDIAGTGIADYTDGGGTAINARLNRPYEVAVDSSRNVYFVDTLNNRIRRVDTSGLISTFAGTGEEGYSNGGGSSIYARLNIPYGLAVDSSRSVYVADTSNHRIRQITANGIISDIAGTGDGGYNGDGHTAISAQVNSPSGVAVDSSGNVYVADTSNHRIRKITVDGGRISTIAGTGVQGYSSGDGIAMNARLNLPSGVAVDSSGNVYVADTDNHLIRKVAPGGVISDIAGTRIGGYNGDGRTAISAQIQSPYAIALDSSGNVYFADSGNHRIRKLYYA